MRPARGIKLNPAVLAVLTLGSAVLSMNLKMLDIGAMDILVDVLVPTDCPRGGNEDVLGSDVGCVIFTRDA